MDMGPTILVMKEAFEDTYQAIGENLDERIDFVQLDPNYRVYYHDDTHLDLRAMSSFTVARIAGDHTIIIKEMQVVFPVLFR